MGACSSITTTATLQARNFFSYAAKVPHAIHNQYGASAGGHIKRDKLFYFADFQGSHDLVGQLATPTIPTMAMRTGNFTASPTIIYDPNTGNTATGSRPDAIPHQQMSRATGSARFSSSTWPSCRHPRFPVCRITSACPRIRPSKSTHSTPRSITCSTRKTRCLSGTAFAHINVTNPGLYGPGLGIYGGPSNSGFDATGPSLESKPRRQLQPHLQSDDDYRSPRSVLCGTATTRPTWTRDTTLSQKFGIPNGNLGGFWTRGWPRSL